MSSGGPLGQGYYNGWSLEERRATIPIQHEAMKTGEMPRPERCSICSCTASTRPLEWHDENYSEPLKAFPVCRRCHRTLHLRWEQPARWLRLLEKVSAPDCWARRLTLDPASQWRPFDETYPDGVGP